MPFEAQWLLYIPLDLDINTFDVLNVLRFARTNDKNSESVFITTTRKVYCAVRAEFQI